MIITCIRAHSKQIFHTKKSEETRAFVNQNLRVFPSFCKCIDLSPLTSMRSWAFVF